MPRYFLETAYMGTNYSGFQVQQNANTIQAEITRALEVVFRKNFELTGSSRTDAGVHALQNFFHFDAEFNIQDAQLYNLNSVLPYDIVCKNIFPVYANAHCRFDATSRSYCYCINRFKNPFLYQRAYYYPYKIKNSLLNEFAEILPAYTDFTSFSKRKTQVNHFLCTIQSAQWIFENDVWKFEIKADRFLRGMVKALVATMLRLAKANASVSEWKNIIESKDCLQADFSAPSEGLFLTEINFKPEIFISS